MIKVLHIILYIFILIFFTKDRQAADHQRPRTILYFHEQLTDGWLISHQTCHSADFRCSIRACCSNALMQFDIVILQL